MTDVKNLHPLEVKLLLNVKKSEVFDDALVMKRTGFSLGHCNQSFSWTSAKGLIKSVKEETLVSFELTERGRRFAEKGFIEQRIFDEVRQNPCSLSDLQKKLSEEQKDIGSAFAFLKKSGIVAMNEEKCVQLVKGASLPDKIKLFSSLVKKAVKAALDEGKLSDEEKNAIREIAKKRSDDDVFRIIERSHVTYELTDEGVKAQQELQKAHITGNEIGEVTREMLLDGSWKDKKFREYDVVNTPVSKLLAGHLNPYAEFIRTIKDKLVAMGFEEFDGSLVENEFWNGDALFMPQFHPARDIHDVYYIENPKTSGDIEQPYLDNVASVHENGGSTGSKGWGYHFDRNFTKRTLLRSQGTVLSAHQLPKAKIPGRYFGVVRCFRYDQVDATHGADFYQTEGIVLGNEVNLKNLLGLLKMFATEIAGASEVKYVPSYFPFTEPSVEVHIKHPVLGWIEMGGSGIFRPEVTRPLGVNCPVLAWGLGIDRMALMNLGLNDIRELFAQDLDSVRLRRG